MSPKWLCMMPCLKPETRTNLGTTMTIVFALFLAITPLGMELVILNVPEPVFEAFMNSSFHANYGSSLSSEASSAIWGLINSGLSIGALFGTLLAVPIAERLGRKTGLMVVNDLVLILGCAVMSAAYPFNRLELLLVGRLLIGVSVGMVCVLLPLFLLETVPQESRGAFGSTIHLFATVGSGLGGFLSIKFILGGETTWPYLLATPALVAGMLVGLSFVFPETPPFHLKHRKNQRVNGAIRFYYGRKVDVSQKLVEIENEMNEAPRQLGPVTVFSNAEMRRGVLIGVVVNIAQVFTGSVSTSSYSSTMLDNVGLPSFVVYYMPTIGALASAVLTLPAVYLVERSGRRQLLLITLLLCLLGNIGMLVFSVLIDYSPDTQDWANLLYSFFFVLFGVSYNIGPGPIAYFLAGELVPPEASGVSLGIAVATNWLSSTATNLLYFPMQEKFQGFAYLLFVIPSAICLPILYCKLPETKKTAVAATVEMSANGGDGKIDVFHVDGGAHDNYAIVMEERA